MPDQYSERPFWNCVDAWFDTYTRSLTPEERRGLAACQLFLEAVLPEAHVSIQQALRKAVAKALSLMERPT